MPEQTSLFDYEQRRTSDGHKFVPKPPGSQSDGAEDTRNAAYQDVRRREPSREQSPRAGSGLPTKVADFGPTQRLVYDVLADAGRPLTDREIVARCDLEVNQVTGRRNDLVTHGLVDKAGKRVCTASNYNGKVSTWALVEHP